MLILIMPELIVRFMILVLTAVQDMQDQKTNKNLLIHDILRERNWNMQDQYTNNNLFKS
jgi:hypothetical protein